MAGRLVHRHDVAAVRKENHTPRVEKTPEGMRVAGEEFLLTELGGTRFRDVKQGQTVRSTSPAPRRCTGSFRRRAEQVGSANGRDPPETASARSAILDRVGTKALRARRVSRGPSSVPRSAAARLQLAEDLFRDFKALTPYRFTPFVRSFDTFDGAAPRHAVARFSPARFQADSARRQT